MYPETHAGCKLRLHHSPGGGRGLARTVMETMMAWCASHQIDQGTLAASDEAVARLHFGDGHEAGALK
jgi:hypothetical protein